MCFRYKSGARFTKVFICQKCKYALAEIYKKKDVWILLKICILKVYKYPCKSTTQNLFSSLYKELSLSGWFSGKIK